MEHCVPPVEVCATLRVLEPSQSRAQVALEPQQTAGVKVTARAAAGLLRAGYPNSAKTFTFILFLLRYVLRFTTNDLWSTACTGEFAIVWPMDKYFFKPTPHWQ